MESVDKFLEYLEIETGRLDEEYKKATKTLAPSNSVLIIMKCEINKVKEIHTKYVQYKNSFNDSSVL